MRQRIFGGSRQKRRRNVTGRRIKPGRAVLYLVTFVWLAIIVPISTKAAPYAAMVMDARSGKVLHSENSETRLHPASLTKMMTLYVAFEAIEHGEISPDALVTISKNAAAEPPSKLGLRPGQKIRLRYLMRAAATKSANDAATAIGEAIAGSEAAFARRMTRTAKNMGMARTTFKNAHGLTESGHLSTAKDMSILGRHVIYDYPEYYNMFGRTSTTVGSRTLNSTNSRFLNSYHGADGIKTGYTRAAGFNLVASAERGRERVIATVFGGRSTVTRNAKVAELLDLGFKRARTRVALRAPRKPVYSPGETKQAVVASAQAAAPKAKVVASAAVGTSLRPLARPARNGQEVQVASNKVQNDIETLLAEVSSTTSLQAADDTKVADADEAVTRAAAPEAVQLASLGVAPTTSVLPVQRPQKITEPATLAQEAEVVTRVSTSGGRHWGVNVGRFPSEFAAQKMLVRTALAESGTLDGALRKVSRRSTGFDANFFGLTRDSADLACRRLQARQITCFMISP